MVVLDFNELGILDLGHTGIGLDCFLEFGVRQGQELMLYRRGTVLILISFI